MEEATPDDIASFMALKKIEAREQAQADARARARAKAQQRR